MVNNDGFMVMPLRKQLPASITAQVLSDAFVNILRVKVFEFPENRCGKWEHDGNGANRIGSASEADHGLPWPGYHEYEDEGW